MADYNEMDSHRGPGPKPDRSPEVRSGGPNDPLGGGTDEPFMPYWQNIWKYVLEMIAVLDISASTSRFFTSQIGTGAAGGWIGAIVSVIAVIAWWRAFNVRNDPATSERPCLVVPGIVRLVIIEWPIYILAIILQKFLFQDQDSKFLQYSWIAYVGLVVLYYMATYQRVRWLILGK